MNRKDFGATWYDERDQRTTRELSRETGKTWAYMCAVLAVASILAALGNDGVGFYILGAAFSAAAIIFRFLNR